ncbi:MAG: DUF3011 domain-containing protein [Pseudoxanthomonas sp.]
MNRSQGLAWLVLLWLLPCAGAWAAVPMFNATCPGALEIHADDGGPVYVNGRQATLKRFNNNYYEARDAQSGTTLSITRADDGGTSLSYTGRNGANGVCTVGQARDAMPSPPASGRDAHEGRGPSEVTCESQDRAQVECEMDTRGEVQVVRRLSKARCEEGQSWGLSRHAVWVKDGCRAVFRNVSRSGGTGGGMAMGGDSTLLGACNVRASAQGALVTRVPVGDTGTELIIDYPDGRYVCMVRNDGLVQSLTRLRGR